MPQSARACCVFTAPVYGPARIQAASNTLPVYLDVVEDPTGNSASVFDDEPFADQGLADLGAASRNESLTVAD